MLLRRPSTPPQKAAMVRLLLLVMTLQPLLISLHFHTVGHELVGGQMLHPADEPHPELGPLALLLERESPEPFLTTQHCACDNDHLDICDATFWFLSHSNTALAFRTLGVFEPTRISILQPPCQRRSGITLWTIAPKASPPQGC